MPESIIMLLVSAGLMVLFAVRAVAAGEILMTANGWFQILFFLALILAVTKPLGVFMARVFNRERTFLDPLLRPLERLLYRVTGVDENPRHGVDGVCLLHADVQRRFHAGAVWDSAFAATAAVESADDLLRSRPTWLSILPPHLPPTPTGRTTAGEATMSYLTQMAGLAYHNFASAAVGIALAIAFIRGIARREKETIGNFWVDMTRATLWVLLPMCIVYALASGLPRSRAEPEAV